jgi:allophanate hydrolase
LPLAPLILQKEASAMPGTQSSIDLVVVGAHLSGMPLNCELVALGASMVATARTTPDYRLFDIGAGKPGLLRTHPGAGAAIEVEVWRMAPAAFGVFVAAIPSPLGVGTIRLEGGAACKGFLVEAVAVETARDISCFGGWRDYCASLAAT